MPFSSHPIEAQHEVFIFIAQNGSREFHDRFMRIFRRGKVTAREHEGSAGPYHGMIGNRKTPSQVNGNDGLGRLQVFFGSDQLAFYLFEVRSLLLDEMIFQQFFVVHFRLP